MRSSIRMRLTRRRSLPRVPPYMWFIWTARCSMVARTCRNGPACQSPMTRAASSAVRSERRSASCSPTTVCAPGVPAWRGRPTLLSSSSAPRACSFAPWRPAASRKWSRRSPRKRARFCCSLPSCARPSPTGSEGRTLLRRQRLEALRAIDDLAARRIGVLPALDLHPLALLEILVVLEEVHDAIERELRQIAHLAHLAIGGKHLVERHRDHLRVLARLVAHGEHADRPAADHAAGQ